jgi:hypothetical protein
MTALRDARAGSDARNSPAFNQGLLNLQTSLQNLGSLVTMQQGGNANVLGANASGAASGGASLSSGIGGQTTATGSLNQTGGLGSANTDARSAQPSPLRNRTGNPGSALFPGNAAGAQGAIGGAQGSPDARSPSSTNLRGQGARGAAGLAGSARQSDLTAGSRSSSSNLRQSGTLSGRSQPATLPSFDERRLVETDFEESLDLMEDQLDELSRASGRFTTAERVLFRQRIDDLEARLRNANMRLNSLQGRSGRAWLEARAEFERLMAELSMQFQETGSLFQGDFR